MRWAVIGSTGLFGQDLLQYLNIRGDDARGFTRSNLHLSDDPTNLAQQLLGFDVWVNCIGYTQVDKAESEIYEANLANGIYAGSLAQAARLKGARFIHISTDYVFDGLSRSPYSVDAPAAPQTSYGKSKELGELLVSESGADYSILRTAWLYGSNGKCFPKVIADQFRKKSSVSVVNDQFGQPTWTRDLAKTVIQVLELDHMPKIVHAVSSGQATWAEFAKEVAKYMGLSVDAVKEISSTEYLTPADRPAWSVLDNSSDILTPIGDWRERWREAAPEVLRGI